MTEPGCQVPGGHGSSFWPLAFVQLVNSVTLGLVISAPDGRIVCTNPALKEILGYSEEELAGCALGELFPPDVRLAVERGCHGLLSGNEPWFRAQVQLHRKDGEPLHTQLTVSALRDAAQQVRWLVMMVNDFTELHLIHERLNYQALHDVGTGLPNRQYFASHLEKVIGSTKSSAVVTMLHLNLDGFSAVNQWLGHRFGDQVLDLVARRLNSVVADQQAMVARISGDEFAILLEPGNQICDVGQLVETINTELAKPVYGDDIRVTITARIGAVQRRAGTTNPAELMRAAGAALRRARDNGMRWTLYDPSRALPDRGEIRLAAEMSGAVDTGELQVEYQPVGALGDGELVGLKAVLTWHHPTMGALGHDRCVELAERTGARHAVGHYLLNTAAQQTGSWQERRQERLPPIAINLSHSQAQTPGLVAQIRMELERTGLPPDGLEIGIPAATLRSPESAPGAVAMDNLRRLAELGVRTAVHDFGGDLHELACLLELQVVDVWISRTAAQHVADNPSAVTAQSFRALIPILRAAGISVVACLVDTEMLADWWFEAGANCAVGALFGQPGTLQGAERLLDADSDGLRAALG